MYCPRCGQQQISEEMRFCSRCGLSMSGLTEWLGRAPALPEQKVPFSLLSPRRKGIRRGAKIMFFSGALLPLFVLLSFALDDPAPLFFPIIALIVGFTIFLYSRLFVDDQPVIPSQTTQTFGLGAMHGGAALPTASIPVHGPSNFSGPQVRTNELAQPPSVTEHTTKLLDTE